MTKQNQLGKTSVVGGGAKSKESWYFVRLAFLAIPWGSRHKACPIGTVFKHYHLIKAVDIKSAFNKARRILSVSEHIEEGGKLNGKRVVFKKVGVINIEPIYQKLRSGVEVFDETTGKMKYSEIKKLTISPRVVPSMLVKERQNAKMPLLDVFLGSGFNQL